MARDHKRDSRKYAGPWFHSYVVVILRAVSSGVANVSFQVSFLNSIVRPDPNVDEFDSGDDEDDEENGDDGADGDGDEDGEDEGGAAPFHAIF